jgi:hydrogenase maturation protease
MTTVLIVGLGNSLLQDDGVGVHAARLLKTDPPPGADVIEGGTDLMSLVPYLERYPQVLALDAMDAGGRPGTLYECALEDLERPGQRVSLHELGLLSVLAFIDPAQCPKIAILGIQPERIGYGLELSANLQARLPEVAGAARELVAQLQNSLLARCHRRREAKMLFASNGGENEEHETKIKP